MIRWPWVSREKYEQDVRFAEHQRDEARQFPEAVIARISKTLNDALDTERARYAELLAKYHTLKLMGATSPDNNPPPPKPEKDIVSEAIIVRSGNNVHLRRHYAEYVTFQRAAGIADVEIAAGILEGESDTDGVP